MDNKPMILIVEDEKPIRNFIKISLITKGYKVIESKNGQESLVLIMSYNPDLIIVSARGQERDKITVLDEGADDYLTKPFSMGELLARVRVSLRRLTNVKGNQCNLLKEYNVEGLKIDFEKRKVLLNNEDIHLTPIEYKIFSLLAKHAGRVLTHNYIIKDVWGEVSGSENQSLRVFMVNIRRKIEKEPANQRYLLTEVGVGID